MSDKTQIFEYEISQIKNQDLKVYVEQAINILPDYFFHVPASSSGKYHPSYTLGEGGLLRHTKAAVRFAIELFGNNTVQNFTQDEKDAIIIALILHDGCKHGLNGSSHTVTTHPIDVVNYLYEKLPSSSLVIQMVYGAISTHMGEWNTDYKTKKVVLETPSSRIQRFVHMCDYLASRKCFEVIL